MGCENICDILVDIFGCHSFRLAIIAGVGRKIGAVFIEKVHSNGSNLVKLGVNCSKYVDICLENS